MGLAVCSMGLEKGATLPFQSKGQAFWRGETSGGTPLSKDVLGEPAEVHAVLGPFRQLEL